MTVQTSNVFQGSMNLNTVSLVEEKKSYAKKTSERILESLMEAFSPFE